MRASLRVTSAFWVSYTYVGLMAPSTSNSGVTSTRATGRSLPSAGAGAGPTSVTEVLPVEAKVSA